MFYAICSLSLQPMVYNRRFPHFSLANLHAYRFPCRLAHAHVV